MSSPQKKKITDLPRELIDAICQCAAIATRSSSSTCCTDYAALCALALTSSSFRHTSQRALFACVSILIASSQGSPGTTATSQSTVMGKWYVTQRQSGMRLLRTIHHSSRLASYVRTLECRADCAGLELVEGSEGFADQLHGVLANTRGLLELMLVLPERSFHGSSASHVLASVNLPLLCSLSLSFPLDANVLRFLTRTPHLQQLELSPDHRDELALSPLEDLSAPRLPALTSFSGSLTDAATLLSGRMERLREAYIRYPKVTSNQDGRVVHVDTATEDEEKELRRLFDSAQNDDSALEKLELHTSLAPLTVIALLASLPVTRDLRAMRLIADFGSAATAGMDFHHAIASHLTSFPLLTSFNLCGMHWPCSPSPSSTTGRT